MARDLVKELESKGLSTLQSLTVLEWVDTLPVRVFNLGNIKVEIFNGRINVSRNRKCIDNWVKYDSNNPKTYPSTPGRYLIYRKKCGKQHFEQWNGRGWASSNNDCTHYQIVSNPN
jgi:hypothetical protein